jgi:hypothetical protein
MKRVDDQALADFQDEAGQQDPRLKDRKAFRGKVTAIKGSGAKVSVEVVKTGETVPSPHAHLVTSTWDPKIGDQTDIYWRDEQSAIAVPVGAEALARMPARHPYQARWYWVGTLTVAPGWTPIGYTNKTNDPSAIYTTSTQNWTIPVSGTYQISIRSGVNVNSDVVAAIYLNGVELTRGTENNASGGINSSTLSDAWPLNKGDNLRGYVFSGASGSLRSGSNENYMAICLLSR